MRALTRLAYLALLLGIGTPSVGMTQSVSTDRPAGAAIPALGAVQDTASGSSSPGSEIPGKQRKVSRPIGELSPVLEWQWGAIFATALAMAGAILLTLPIALVYMWTKPAHESDPSVMHSALILAPTIAGILIVIQGSLAMAFSLAGVATAVRFRNSLKDTNDAVYVFVAVAIGLAAGVQALDIALAISLIFSAIVVLLSRSPFRNTGTAPQPAHGHHRQHQHEGAAPVPAGPTPAPTPEPTPGALPWVEYITIRTGDAALARSIIEPLLERETKRWRLERTASKDETGAVTLRYAVRCRKRTPYDRLRAELSASVRSQEFTVESASGKTAPPQG